MHLIGGNVGETDEPVLIEKLVSLIGVYVEVLGFAVKSVASYHGTEYSIGTRRSQISKAPTHAKRDVIINGKGYSLKSSRAAPAAIVNHTTREKWIAVCQRNGLEIGLLDDMVSEYWELRTRNRIGEDIPTSSPNCPFGNTEPRRQYLKILISYFLFDGTGSGDSRYPADYILEFANPTDPTAWCVLDKESAFQSMWPKMVFSIRSTKGMPSAYPDIGAPKKTLIEPWVRHIDGAYRGALHIRTRK